MTVQEAIDALKAGGWKVVTETEQLQQLTHESHRLTVTICGGPGLHVPPGVLRSLIGHAKIEESR